MMIMIMSDMLVRNKGDEMKQLVIIVALAAASRVAEDRHEFRRDISAAISLFWPKRP